MRTAIFGFLGLMLLAAILGSVIGQQHLRMAEDDEDFRIAMDMSPEVREHLAQNRREEWVAGGRRLVTHVLGVLCLGLAGVVIWQRAVYSKQREKAERWKALYEGAAGRRRALQTELSEKGPHTVKHSRDKTYSALCARCGCVMTERFETRGEAEEDRARTETTGCLACPSEARSELDVARDAGSIGR